MRNAGMRECGNAGMRECRNAACLPKAGNAGIRNANFLTMDIFFAALASLPAGLPAEGMAGRFATSR